MCIVPTAIHRHFTRVAFNSGIQFGVQFRIDRAVRGTLRIE
jgi:hypothetical protein